MASCQKLLFDMSLMRRKEVFLGGSLGDHEPCFMRACADFDVKKMGERDGGSVIFACSPLLANMKAAKRGKRKKNNLFFPSFACFASIGANAAASAAANIKATKQ